MTVFVAICNALEYAHTQLILHCDLKPTNVMLGKFGEAIVIDWGLAKFKAKAKTDPSSEITIAVIPESSAVDGQGTLNYMAPEQAGQKRNIDHRSDIYGLGGILFEILTGRPPRRGSRQELIEKVLKGDPPSAKEFGRTVPAALKEMCLKALAKEKDDRYETAAELAKDLNHYLAGDPVSVSEPWLDRRLRWVRNHPAAAASAALFLFAIAVTVSIANWLINGARGREELAKQTAVDRLSDAEHAVDVSLTGVTEVLKFYPSAQSVRERLLEQAATDYAKFASVNSDDVKLQLETARALIRLGNVRLMLGKFDAAITEFDAADKRLSPIESQLKIATFERGIAAAQRAETLELQGQSNEAKTAFEKSLELLNRGAAALPADSPRRAEVAEAQLGLARVLQQLGDLDGARSKITESLPSLKLNPGAAISRDVRRVAAKAEHALAELEIAANQLDAASEPLTRALQHYAALLLVEKNYPVWLDGQALCRFTLGNLQRRQGHEIRALETYQKAVDDFDDLADAIPGVPHYEYLCILSHHNMESLRLALGQSPLAHQRLASSIGWIADLAKGDKPPDLTEIAAIAHATFGTALRDLGQTANAEKALQISRQQFQELQEVRPTPDVRRRAAVVVGQLARISAESGRLDESLQLFREADEVLRILIAENDADADSKNALAAICRHRADVLFAADHREEAAPLYRQASSLWRELPDEVELHIGQLWLLLACVDETSRDPALAVTIAEKLRARAPESVRLLALLSLAKAQLGDTDAAERFAKQSRQLLAEGNTTAAFVLALVEHQRGRKEDARTAFETATQQMTDQHPASWSARRLQEIVEKELGQN
ncbi:MAG: protein kinase [Planctomycetaceae bacterium]|nr:protein kinase [Planctomycetaceae bacterium]